MQTRDALIARFVETRRATEALAEPLSPEDQVLQSQPDCSPTKWHRAHTTWFFETFVLAPRGVAPVDARYGFLFNSYYEAVGPRHARPKRGVLSRPSCDEVAAYRRAVDGRVVEVLSSATEAELAALAPVIALGVAHEEQHQELILTDILHALSLNPMKPAYRASSVARDEGGAAHPALAWRRYEGGLVEVGAAEGAGFVFDNEGPRHKTYLAPFELATRAVTVGEALAFMADGGYATPALWMSAGWDWVRANEVTAPGHARVEGGALVVFGVDGERQADAGEPVCFVSWYEADAMARYFNARLPTEEEWEHAAAGVTVAGNFRDAGALRPRRELDRERVAALRRRVEWTRSSYEPYPGYAPTAGALGEYNGKFMVNQRVLRGGSFLSNAAHLRATYRNFWYPDTRFQATGLRLARDARA
ncbi:MAG: ergothioneine biosynthesis protein EgtB [Polyangiales bacterium]